MRKLAVLLLLISSLLLPAFSLTKKSTQQDIYGFINEFVDISVSDFYFESSNGGKGINFNTEQNTNYRYLIAPTGTPLTLTGLKVGEFTVVASHSGYKLVVTHGPLVKTGNDPVSYDYELGVSYAIGGTTYTKICLATDNPAMADPDHKITISLRSGDSVVVIQNAGIYFRMTNGNVITTVGNYASTVTFTLEAET